MFKSSFCIIAAICISFLTSEVGIASEVISQEATVEAQEKPSILLAKKRKRSKKKRRKKKAKVEAGVAAEGKTMHAAHEGLDKPYQYQVGLYSDFAILNSQTGDSKSGSGKYTLNLRALYIIGGSFEAGGELDYSETTVKGKESEKLDRSYVLTVLGVYNFGNLDVDQTIFFVKFGFGFGSATSSSKVGDEKVDGSASITRLTLGLGMHYFVDSNVAITTQFVYDSDTSKDEDADDPTVTSTIHLAKIGFSLFI